MLALRQAIPGRGVIIADARVPGGLQRGGRLRFGDDLEQIAEASSAKAELRDVDLSRAKAAVSERGPWVCSDVCRGGPACLAARRALRGWCALSAPTARLSQIGRYPSPTAKIFDSAIGQTIATILLWRRLPSNRIGISSTLTSPALRGARIGPNLLRRQGYVCASRR